MYNLVDKNLLPYALLSSYNSNSQHVPDRTGPLNRPSNPNQPGSSQPNTAHVFSNSSLESSTLSSSSTRHVAINSNSPRPRTSSQVFNNVSDLAAHYGIPQSLPRAPRTTPRRPEELVDSSVLSDSTLDFASLCSNYLTMLSQNSTSHGAPEETRDSAPPPAQQASDVDAVQSLMDVLNTSPDFSMAHSFDEYNEFLTSPLIDSPLDDDILTTPAVGSADINADIYTSPLIADYGDSFGDMSPLFDDPSIYTEIKDASAPLPMHALDGMYSISPDTPFFDPPSDSPMLHSVSKSSSSPDRRKTSANGTRKNVTPESLVPVDAPTQSRNYLTPSATSRKELPAVFARKRARSTAFAEEEDQLAEDDASIKPIMTEQEQIEAKRRQNTIAARRSRRRKLEYQRELEDNVERYKRDSEQWKSRALMYQALLRSHNIEAPDFPDF